MSRPSHTPEPLFLALFPYGARPGIDLAYSSADRWTLGTACVRETGQLRREAYVLEKAGPYWQLLSRLDAGDCCLLGRVPASQLPASTPQAGAAILCMLWEHRQPARMQWLEWLGGGLLGDDPLPIRTKRTSCYLARRLRAEGHTVLQVRGPMGTDEHLLVLKSSRPTASPSLSFQPPVADSGPPSVI